MLELIRSAPQNPALGWFAGDEALGAFLERGLFERNAQRLRRTARGFRRGLLLDELFAFLRVAPWSQDELAIVERGDETVPRGELHDAFVASLLGAFEHFLLNLFAQFRATLRKVRDADSFLGAVVAASDDAGVVF